MHAQVRTYVHGNWIWLVSASTTVALLATAALNIGGRGACPATGGPSRAPGGARTAVDATARFGAGGTAQRTGSGLALYYNPGTAMGSCALGPFPPGGLYASLPPGQYAHGAACGSFLDVRGPRGVVRAEVVDLCSGCAATTINLSESAFARVADPRPGSAPVTYREVANPRLPGPLVIRVIPTTTPGLIAIQVLNHGNRISSVAAAGDGGSAALGGAATAGPSSSASAGPVQWRPFFLGSNGFWVSTAGLGSGPFALRISDDRGHQVMLTHLSLRPGTVVRRQVWMYPATVSQASARAERPLPPATATTAPAGC